MWCFLTPGKSNTAVFCTRGAKVGVWQRTREYVPSGRREIHDMKRYGDASVSENGDSFANGKA